MAGLMKASNQLIESAVNDPGGENMRIATENLNEYFRLTDIPSTAYRLDPAENDFIIPMFGKSGADQIKVLQSSAFTIRDARHIEDCLLYQTIVRRIAGQGDDLTRVRRVFDWIVSNIVLVPPQSLRFGELSQAQARPHDVLFRGMATEVPQTPWAERTWLFIAFCRQLNLDAAVLAYNPRGSDEHAIWIPGVVIDNQVYLFDPRVGVEIPGPDGTGVATLEQAATTSAVLDQLDLPGQSYYGTTRADLSGGKIDVLLDSSQGYFSPRMKFLQERLVGKSKMILFREAFRQRDAFAKALGKRMGKVQLWALPINVFESQFNSSQYTTSLMLSMSLFVRELPLLKARLDELRGDFPLAKNEYFQFRFPESPIMLKSSKEHVSEDVQYMLDLCSTYFLGLCQLEEGTAESKKAAKDLFGQAMKLMPEEGPGKPMVCMYRRNAVYNLAKLEEEDGNFAQAVRLYTDADPTPQRHGRMLKARALVTKNPFLEPAPPLPPAPAAKVFAKPKASQPSGGPTGNPVGKP